MKRLQQVGISIKALGLLLFLFSWQSFCQELPKIYARFYYKNYDRNIDYLLQVKDLKKLLTGKIEEDAQYYVLHALSSYLDKKGQEFYFYPHVPEYRKSYIIQYIFQGQLGKDEYRPKLSNQENYESLKRRFKKDKSLIPVFKILWGEKFNGIFDRDFIAKINKSELTWPDFTIGLKEIPERYTDFEKQVHKQSNRIYQALKRKRVLDLLLKLSNKDQFIEPTPYDIQYFFNVNKEKFKKKRAEFQILSITFPKQEDKKKQDLAIEKYLNLSKKIEQESSFGNNGLTAITLNQTREKTKNLLLSEVKSNFPKNILVKENRILWQQDLKKKEELSTIERFLLAPNIGNKFMPKLLVNNKDGSKTIISLIKEKPLSEVIPKLENVFTEVREKTFENRYLMERENLLEDIFRKEILFNKRFPHTYYYLLAKYKKSGRAFLADCLSFNINDETKGIERNKDLHNKFNLTENNEKPQKKKKGASNNTPVYRLPELFNTNALAGRLYLQPIGPYEYKVIEGLKIDGTIFTAGEYNRFFHNGAYGEGKISQEDEFKTPAFYHNNRYYTLRISYGYKLKGFKLESGAIFRVQQDVIEDSEMSVFLLEFHSIGDNSPGHIPSTGLPMNGVIGNNNTLVLGDNGQLYLGSADLYTKLQVLEKGDIKWIDNLAVKASVRVPIKSDEFNNFGFGLSIGAEKELLSWLSLVGAASLSYQDLEAEDFNADDIEVKNYAWDIYLGFVFDPGDKGGFYIDAGLRFSNERISYIDNRTSSRFANVIHMSLNWERKSGWTYYLGIGEEIPNLDGALEPDFVAFIGAEYRLNYRRTNTKLIRSKNYHE